MAVSSMAHVTLRDSSLIEKMKKSKIVKGYVIVTTNNIFHSKNCKTQYFNIHLIYYYTYIFYNYILKICNGNKYFPNLNNTPIKLDKY